MRRTPLLVALGLALLVAMPAPSDAQRPSDVEPARRARMERQLRQGLWRIARERVPLSDAQMRKLEDASARFEVRRRALNVEERRERQTLRTELAAGEGASQERVGDVLDRLLQLQRQRVELLADEQRELATFMTPVQRARYGALQEQLRRRVDAARRRRAPVPTVAP